jgi:hypothetical protein
MGKVAGSPLFPLNLRKLSQKLKFWESLCSNDFVKAPGENSRHNKAVEKVDFNVFVTRDGSWNCPG